jgi:hypothetical protein
MRKLLVSAAVAGAMLMSSRTLADDELHCAAPGTRLVFNNTGYVAFIGQEGLACLVEVPNSKAPEVTNIIHVLLGLSSSKTWVENHAERLFPFKVGNEIEFTSSADSSHIAGIGTSSDRLYYRDNIKVLRQEKVNTKVGSFDTWVIEDRQVSQGRISGTWITTYWWAPDLGYFVKRTYEVRAGLGTDQSIELTSLTTPPLASPPATSSVPPTKSTKSSTVTPPSTSGSPAERLQALKDLLDRKLITPSEYETKRKAIIDAM